MLSHAVPSIATVALHVSRYFKSEGAYILHGDLAKETAQKTIAVLQTGDVAIDAAFQGVMAAWFAQLGQQNSAFFALLNRQLITKIPLHARIGTSSGGYVGQFPGEGAPSVVQRLIFDSQNLKPRTALAFSAITDEALQAGGEGLNDALNNSINLSINTAIDTAVADDLSQSTADGASASGTSAVHALADLTAALKSVFSLGQSPAKAVWIASPSAVIALMTLALDGALLFPDLSVAGGSLLSIPVLISSGWPTGALTLLDGSQACGGADLVGLAASNAGSYSASMNPSENAGTGVGEAQISAFQSSTTLIRSVTRFSFAMARGSSAFTLLGVDQYVTAGA